MVVGGSKAHKPQHHVSDVRAWLVSCNLVGCTAGAMSDTMHKCDLGWDASIMAIQQVA